MGSDKALLEVKGKPMALRTAALAAPLVDKVWLVGDPDRHGGLGLEVLADRVQGRGPLAGIVTALECTSSEWNLIVACDLPYLEARFLSFILDRASACGDCDAVVPRLQRGWQPLCAVYRKRCLTAFEQVLASPKPKISLAYERLRVEALDADELERFAFPARMFKNMNTPEEYAEANRTLG